MHLPSMPRNDVRWSTIRMPWSDGLQDEANRTHLHFTSCTYAKNQFLSRLYRRRQVRSEKLSRVYMATILVIDDEPSIRGLLKEVLVKAGHRVLEAENGRKGLTLYQNELVDLVIMDLLMPETDGLEATLQLTREYVDAKVIAITGAQGDHNFLDIAKLFGARRAFEKPFDINKLLDAVKEELAA
jgi:two-component system, response regulator, stage 0 sporulation protein F